MKFQTDRQGNRLHVRKKIILHAGGYCFDQAGTQIHTLLGSCVAITLWHPTLLIGGMCHYALPFNASGNKKHKLDSRYADDCMALFERSAARHGTHPVDYQAKVFGGGNMYERFPGGGMDMEERQRVGEKNARAAFELLSAAGVTIMVAHVGEFGYRRIVFDITTGDVWVRFSPASAKHRNSYSPSSRI